MVARVEVSNSVKANRSLKNQEITFQETIVMVEVQVWIDQFWAYFNNGRLKNVSGILQELPRTGPDNEVANCIFDSHACLPSSW